MHPFALNDDVLDQVNGGTGSNAGRIGFIIDNPITPIKPIAETTLALGEEGGWYPNPT